MKREYIILVFLLFASLRALTQTTCTGTLGDNIFLNGDFGRGTEPVLFPDPNIAPGYNYSGRVVPEDGSYTICQKISDLQNVYGPWLDVKDNSTDPEGYMMVINASYSPGVFYEERVEGLCGNTLYEFSADIINLINANNPGLIDPNVSFLIDGVVQYSTGDVPKSEQWDKYGFSFVTDPEQEDLVLSIRNNAPGGGGNDLALDNISFRPCGPSTFIGTESGGEENVFYCQNGEPIEIIGGLENLTGQVYVIQWEISLDGINWTRMNETDVTLLHTDFTPGDYYYRFVTGGSIENLENPKCTTTSEILHISIQPSVYEIKDTICEGSSYRLGDLQLDATGLYEKQFISVQGCDSTVMLDLFVVAPSELIYDLTTSAPNCPWEKFGFFSVDGMNGGNGGVTYEVWKDNMTVVYDSLTPGNYLMRSVDQYGCLYENSFVIEQAQPIDVEIGRDTSVRFGDEFFIDPDYSTATKFIDWQWSGEGSFECMESCEENTILPYRSGYIIVESTDENGCQLKDSLYLTVENIDFLHFPNVFSPNDDGINDTFSFQFYKKTVAQIVRFEVYDRWGMQVNALLNEPATAGMVLWDGFKGAKRSEAGTYSYAIEIELYTGDRIYRVGSFVLMD